MVQIAVRAGSILTCSSGLAYQRDLQTAVFQVNFRPVQLRLIDVAVEKSIELRQGKYPTEGDAGQ
jgi:hypothetical protein